MTFEETAPFDHLIWSPNIVELLIEYFPDSGGAPVIDVPEYAMTWIENILKIKRRERQPKPIDWLIFERNKIIIDLAVCWIDMHDGCTPLKFVKNVWNPLSKVYFSNDPELEADEEFNKRIISIGKNYGIPGVDYSETPELYCLVNGIICCFQSMESLDSGDIQTTVKILLGASLRVGEHYGASALRGINNVAAENLASRSSFAQSGAAGRHKGSDALIPKVQAYYIENGHEYDNKEKAAVGIAEIFGVVSDRTVGRWLIGLKPRHPKPDKVPR